MQVNNQFNKHILLSMLLFPLANLGLCLFGCNVVEVGCNLEFWVKKIVICLLVAIAEELFFRGLILRELVFSYKWLPVRASVFISLVFGILHLVNVNSYATWGYAIVQSICAVAVSFNLCAIFIKTNSLLWCVFIHTLTNVTSVGAGSNSIDGHLVLNNMEAIIFLLISFVYLLSGIKMLNNKIVEGK